MPAYNTSMEHLLAELERIDLLIQMQVWQARQSQTLDNNFAGLVLSDTEIDHLLAQALGAPRWVKAQDIWTASEAQAALQSLTETIHKNRLATLENGILLRLILLQQIFGLTEAAINILLICLAPELDSRYGQFYAYLQNDVSKKRPTIDLILNLLCASFADKVILRQWFEDSSPLIHYHLIHIEDSEDQLSLSQPIKIDSRILNYLLETDQTEASIQQLIEPVMPLISLDNLIFPDAIRHQLNQLAQYRDNITDGLTLYFQGDYGVGRQSTAAALCAAWARPLLVVDTPQVVKTQDFARYTRLIFREALLTGGLLYWDAVDILLEDEHISLLKQFFRQFDIYSGVVFLSGERIWQPRDLASARHFIHIAFPRPIFTERVTLWEYLLPDADVSLRITEIANNFRFTAGQISDAIATAKGLALADNPRQPQLTNSHLQQACRLQSNRRLSTLSQVIQAKYTWDDIVLPAAQKNILWEIHNQVRYRWRVYHEWGFDRKLSLGKGLNVLFAGPSGTGKTMAAEIIANALGFDLYKIDLSSVISKYIGETEKHLAQIFDEAQSSNAILFFDEADAIFGKRSDVSDAQDRFANIQVSFLLQRMEEYDGVVVLTSNLRKNMDEAFVRRMHFIVEFPFPDAEYREQIWRNVFPEETPLSNDIDWGFLAERFDITGGNIRNIALAAAFFAVEDNTSVQMQHLLRATQREFQKMGKIVTNLETYIKT